MTTSDPHETRRWDWDGPERTLRLRSALQELGYFESADREFRSSRFGIPVRIPKPAGSINQDPYEPTRDVLGRGSSIVLLTPLQTMSSLVERSRGVIDASVQSEMFHLIRSQAVDLDLLMGWARSAGFLRLRVLLPSLEAAQRAADTATGNETAGWNETEGGQLGGQRRNGRAAG